MLKYLFDEYIQLQYKLIFTAIREVSIVHWQKLVAQYLIEKETNTMRDFEARIRREIAPFTDVPILFISALTKQRLFKAIETAVTVFENRKKRISTSKLKYYMTGLHHSLSPSKTL